MEISAGATASIAAGLKAPKQLMLDGNGNPLFNDGTRAQRLAENSITRGYRRVTDAEVLQEILHRFVAIGRREAIQPAFDAIPGVVDEGFAITEAHVKRAREIVTGMPRLSAREAVHVAVMEGQGSRSIMTFDAGFDGVPGIEQTT